MKAITIKLHFESVALKTVEAGFVSQLSLIYKDKQPQLTELKGLRVSRSVENVAAKIGAVTLTVDVDNVELFPLSGETVDVDLVLKGQCPNGAADLLHNVLHEESDVSLTERQKSLAPEPE